MGLLPRGKINTIKKSSYRAVLPCNLIEQWFSWKQISKSPSLGAFEKWIDLQVFEAVSCKPFVRVLSSVSGRRKRRGEEGVKKTPKEKRGMATSPPPPPPPPPSLSLLRLPHKGLLVYETIFQRVREEDSQHRIYLLSMSFFAVSVSNRWTVTSWINPRET